MTTAQEPIRAYHLLAADGRLARGDGREVRVGETLEVEVEPRLCKAGLHASVRCLDTLQYSPGDNPRLCLVEVSGDVEVGEDKICGRRRKVTAMLTSAQTAKVLQEFACRAAEMALDVAEQNGGDAEAVAAVAAGRKAVEMARRYRRGDCTEAELKAARDAARAAGHAAWAARYAARTARYAAGAARYAARTARYAARTARYAAEAELYAAWAAEYAAWAAGDGARAGVSRDQLAAVLEGMVTETFAQAEV